MIKSRKLTLVPYYELNHWPYLDSVSFYFFFFSSKVSWLQTWGSIKRPGLQRGPHCHRQSFSLPQLSPLPLAHLCECTWPSPFPGGGVGVPGPQVIPKKNGLGRMGALSALLVLWEEYPPTLAEFTNTSLWRATGSQARPGPTPGPLAASRNHRQLPSPACFGDLDK